MHSEFRDLAGIAQEQHGVVSVRQALELGLSRRQLRRSADAGVVDFVHPQVVRLCGTVRTTDRSTWAAVLQVPGSVASHQAALALHRVPNVPFGVSIAVASTGRSGRHGIQVHRVGDLLPEHLVTVDGIPTTSLPRTVVDVSSQFGRSRMAYLIDHLTIRLLLEID